MLYRKVMQHLRERIESQEFRIGDNLPSEKLLSEYYQVSRITVRKAIDELVKKSMIEKRQGAGSMVVNKTMISSMSTLRSTSEYMAEAGAEVRYKLLEFQLIDPDDETVAALEIDHSEKVYFIRRYKTMNGTPCIYEDSYLPATLFPQLNIRALESSKYRYFEQELGFHIDGATQDFNAILPNQSICKVLELPEGKPIIALSSVGKLKDGRIFEYTKLCFKPDTYSFKHYVQR